MQGSVLFPGDKGPFVFCVGDSCAGLHTLHLKRNAAKLDGFQCGGVKIVGPQVWKLCPIRSGLKHWSLMSEEVKGDRTAIRKLLSGC